MRVLLFLLAPFMGYSQLDTTITYRQKEVHSINIGADTASFRWVIDTVRYSVDFEIKFNKTKKSIAIDGYGTYKYLEYYINPSSSRPTYMLSNGGEVSFFAGAIIWVWPIVKSKTKTIVFECKSPS
jgi:hypothetical protein